MKFRLPPGSTLRVLLYASMPPASEKTRANAFHPEPIGAAPLAGSQFTVPLFAASLNQNRLPAASTA